MHINSIRNETTAFPPNVTTNFTFHQRGWNICTQRLIFFFLVRNRI